MTQTVEFSSDFNFLYRNGSRFYPIIQDQVADGHLLDSSNAVLITLSAKADDELIWEKERVLAQRAISEGKMILWELDFGLNYTKIDSSDSALFYSFGIAIDEFVNSLYKEFLDSTIGCSLFRGDAFFSQMFLWTEEQKEIFLEKISHLEAEESLKTKIENAQEYWYDEILDEKAFEMFAADVFAQYFQRLASYLPDTLLAFCLLDVSEYADKAFIAEIFSKERFSHLLLALKRSPIPSAHLNWEEGACYGGWIGSGSPYISAGADLKYGVCLPSEDRMNKDTRLSLSWILDLFTEKQVPYRIIPESLLTEAWDGIDHIVVVSSSLSLQGKRRLQGFCAAGGSVVHLGLKIGLPQEISWEEFSLQLQQQEVLI